METDFPQPCLLQCPFEYAAYEVLLHRRAGAVVEDHFLNLTFPLFQGLLLPPVEESFEGCLQLISHVDTAGLAVLGTAEALPVDTGTIDAAYATNALHHFDNIDAAAAEVSLVTKPGARVVFVEEQFTNPEHPSYERFGGDDHDDHEHRFHAVDLEKVSTVMDAAGFDVVEASDTTIADVPAKLVRLQRR